MIGLVVVFLSFRESSATQPNQTRAAEQQSSQDTTVVQPKAPRPSTPPESAPKPQALPPQTTPGVDQSATQVADRQQRARPWATALNGLGWNMIALDNYSRRSGNNRTMGALAPLDGELYQVRVPTQAEYDKMLRNSNHPNARQFIGRWNEFVELIMYIEQANPRVVTGVRQFAKPTGKNPEARDPAARAAEIADIMKGWGWNFQSQIIGLQFGGATQNVLCSFEGKRYQIPAYTQAGFNYFIDLKIQTLRGAQRAQAEALRQRYDEFIELLLYIEKADSSALRGVMRMAKQLP